ncbi:MATE family efflux transporter [Halegenticoccus tardaugens]|uniref:MATE family efflux transporter n=1 Tax=Halegenticoccus tardaugens TaxID=2071624 RepID=UPI001E30A1C5|nr:MATE family efflux transporter [Halegenticoccus tardaugens]
MQGKWINPVRELLAGIGRLLVRLNLIDERRVTHTTDLAWPRIVTGLARMSKSAVDIAMVGLAVGPAAIAGVGFATPFWGLAFALGGGVADGAIGLISQRYSANRHDELDATVKASAALAAAVTLPVAALFWFLSEPLVALVGSGGDAVTHGATYLRIVSLGIPFAALNLVGSRTLVGADDARIPMLLRAGGAVANVSINAVLVFGLGLGVVGAAVGTVLANVVVTAGFALGLVRGVLPLVGRFPVTVDPSNLRVDRSAVRGIVDIGTPLVLTNLARTLGQFPLLAIVGLFGPNVVAAFVIALRVRALMDTPGWGFSLASSSLVGQALGKGAEWKAEGYARDVLRFSIVVYLIVALVVAAFSEPIGRSFVDDPTVLPLVDGFIYAACASVVFYGVIGGATGPLRASGDTRWPLYGQVLGFYVFALPIAYLGVATSLGVAALSLALVAETLVPALVTYYRFDRGRWKAISRSYRPDVADD